MKTKNGFTLIEIIITLVIIGVLTALSIGYYSHIKDKAKNSEAVITAGNIRSAELANKMAGGSYVAANTTEEINQLLPVGVEPKDYEYRIVGVSDENFLILATKIDTGEIVVAMDKDGLLHLGGGSGSPGYPPTGGGSSGSSGGGSGGSGGDTGGIGGGSSGGGSGGTGGGSSGGSSSGGSGSSSSSETSVGPSATTEVSLLTALSLLQNTTYGDALYDLIIANNIGITYANLGGALGLWIPSWWLHLYPEDNVTPNTIYISSDIGTTWSAEAIAAVIVHEANHADYTYNTEKWVTLTTEHFSIDRSKLNWLSDPVAGGTVLGDSIDQEYNCFVQEALFWNEKRGTQSNEELDFIWNEYNLGGTELYDDVVTAYEGYKPYQKELK